MLSHICESRGSQVDQSKFLDVSLPERTLIPKLSVVVFVVLIGGLVEQESLGSSGCETFGPHASAAAARFVRVCE